jgi:hypothetical protein
MNREISENWFHRHFVPEVRAFPKERGLLQKALLLIDSASSDPRNSILTSNNGLSIRFLPPSITAVMQSMDQGEMASMKRCYEADLLRTLADEDISITALWKK